MEKITEQQYRSLKRIIWDYNISAEEIMEVVSGERAHAGHWKQDDLLIRMLERLGWYDLLDFFPPETLAQKLIPELLCRVHNKEKRAKYERLGKILRKEPVSYTKWGPEYRAECKDTLFSNRWYST